MSKAYYFVKNFNWQEVKNLLCYSAKHPEALTNQQRVTRLYRNTLRRYQALKLEGYRTDFGDYNKAINAARADFDYMLTLKPDSYELRTYLDKYEKVQEELFDPSMHIDESRPYAGTSSRYLIWPDECLKFDPFGYYKQRLATERRPAENVPLFVDYPMNDTHWVMWEQFPEGFDDEDHAGNQIK